MGRGRKEKIVVLSHEKILFDCRRDLLEMLPFNIFLGVLVLIWMGFIGALVLFNASDFLGTFAQDGIFFVIKLILIVFVGVLVPLWLILVPVISIFEEIFLYLQIKNQKYDVFDDVLVSVSSSEAYPVSIRDRLLLRTSKYRTVNYYATLYFSGAGRLPVGRRMYEWAEIGDRSYIVMLRGKTPEVYGVYSQKLYLWEGDPQPLVKKANMR